MADTRNDSAPHVARNARQRGHAAALMVVLLVTLSLLVTAMIARTGRGRDVAVQQAGGARALYAAEAALSMSAREISLANDADGDGVIGSIGTEKMGPPTLGGAALSASASVKGGKTHILASGRTSTAIREVAETLK